MRCDLLAIAGFNPAIVWPPDPRCGHLPFLVWIVGVLAPRVFVDLCTNPGNSYFAICQAVSEARVFTECYALHCCRDEQRIAELDSYNESHYSTFSRLLPSDRSDTLSRFSDGSIGLLSISETAASYGQAKQVFESCLSKLAPGAILLLHGTTAPDCAVGNLWNELRVRYAKTFEFVHSGGLGVIKTDHAPFSGPLAWLEQSSPEQPPLRNYFAALGADHLERMEHGVAKAEICRLAHDLSERDSEVSRLKRRLSEVDRLNEIVVSERDLAIVNLATIRRSMSWRLTAPLRLLGYLVTGDFERVTAAFRVTGRRLLGHLPLGMQRGLEQLTGPESLLLNSSSNRAALAAIVAERCAFSRSAPSSDPLNAATATDPPTIDISAVTYNSGRWIAGFVESLLAVDYPKGKLFVRFVDNGSADSTLAELQSAAARLQSAGCAVRIIGRPNHGFGAGHNAAIQDGNAPFLLVTNVDLAFEPDALMRVVSTAVADSPNSAAWELRQKPYEHPKFYDPVTGTTNWNSHACVLLRRTAMKQVMGYDESLFLYAEDVEVSYRLRRAGYLLRYCPSAAVFHYSYEFAGQRKPLQYAGSTFGNLYIRLKYGNWMDVLAIPLLALRLVLGTRLFPLQRRTAVASLVRLLRLAPGVLSGRQGSKAHFPFRVWEYDLVREGAFFPVAARPTNPPLVTVITRTYAGRSLYLRQAILSVAHQTYPRVEHIVVEDGGDTQRSVIEEMSAISRRPITFVGLCKGGRSAAGNAGLVTANGRWCLFLDDDDLLFADHVEVLVGALLANPQSVAAYSLAWEVVTDSALLDQGEYDELSYTIPVETRQPFDHSVLLHHNFMAIQSVLFERYLFSERGGFELDMEALEDWILWIKYATDNCFTYVEKVTSLFRTPADPAVLRQRKDAFDAAYPLALARAQHSLGKGRRQWFSFSTSKLESVSSLEPDP